MKIGLSLGGGGSRGYAHLGAIRALEEAAVPIQLINGSSIGAVVGGAYALYGDAARVLAIVEEVVGGVNVNYFNVFHYSGDSGSFLRNWLVNAMCDLGALRASVLSHRNNLRALELLFGESRFADTRIPFSSVAVDLLAGETVVIREGRLADGVLPSMSIPGIFPPVEKEGRLLVDGCVLADTPAHELRREGADFVIAIALGKGKGAEWRNGFDVLNRVETVKEDLLDRWELGAAGFEITIDLPHYDSTRFDNSQYAIAQGYEAVTAALPRLERRLAEANA